MLYSQRKVPLFRLTKPKSFVGMTWAELCASPIHFLGCVLLSERSALPSGVAETYARLGTTAARVSHSLRAGAEAQPSYRMLGLAK